MDWNHHGCTLASAAENDHLHPEACEKTRGADCRPDGGNAKPVSQRKAKVNRGENRREIKKDGNALKGLKINQGQIKIDESEEENSDSMTDIKAHPGFPHRRLAGDPQGALLHGAHQIGILGHQFRGSDHIEEGIDRVDKPQDEERYSARDK